MRRVLNQRINNANATSPTQQKLTEKTLSFLFLALKNGYDRTKLLQANINGLAVKVKENDQKIVSHVNTALGGLETPREGGGPSATTTVTNSGKKIVEKKFDFSSPDKNKVRRYSD